MQYFSLSILMLLSLRKRLRIPALLLCLCGSMYAWQSPPAGTVGLRIIVVNSAEAAQQILEKVKGGADFAKLARENSTDPTAEDGGNMGRVDPSSLRAELQQALKGLGPGQTTGVLKLPSGYAILQVIDAAPPGNVAQGSPAQSNPAPTSNATGIGMLPVSGRGNIRNPTDVSGAIDVDIAFRKMPKPEGWEHDSAFICELRKKSLATGIEWLTQITQSSQNAPAGFQPADFIQARSALAQLLAYQGKMGEAIEQWQSGYQMATTDAPGMLPQLEESLGIAYFHKAEMENDAYTKPGDRCLFPPKHASAYKNTTDVEKSIQHALKYLEKKPEDIEVKWLLNLDYMVLGKYPAGVPAKYLISPAAFASKEDIGRFVDVAPEAGLTTFSMAGGVIVDDFDNDGLLDVVTSSYNMCEHMHFFHNNGDGTFTERTEQAGLANQFGGLNIIQADYNNDGCMDILLLRGGWQFPMGVSLLKNNCNGTFSDVTNESGLGDFVSATQTAAWADIDNDGNLDLFVGNEQGQSHLFRNKGDGTFEDISHSAGIDAHKINKGVVAADYDNDGFVDFFVSNITGDNFLWHNNHDRTFTEVAAQAGVQKPWTSFATWFFDYDNDGWPDLFVNSYYISVDETMRSYLGMPGNAETLKLYKNMGDGTFKDVTVEAKLDRVFMPMGANFGDLDNDGFLDMYLGTGNPSYISVVPNVLLHNHEGKYFTDITASSGTGELHKGHGVAFADIDRDGDEDLLAEIGGATEGDAHTFRLFENPGNGNDWTNLKLVGVKSNRGAIGARIKVTVENEGKGQRSIYRTVGSGGSFGASPLEQHIGLGKAARILEIEVWWPASNTRQTFNNVEKNQFLEIKEFAPAYTKLVRKSFQLGGAKREAVEKAAAQTAGNKK